MGKDTRHLVALFEQTVDVFKNKKQKKSNKTDKNNCNDSSGNKHQETNQFTPNPTGVLIPLT